MFFMTEAYQYIKGYEKVVEAFSCWPSFDDGEVVWMSLHREKGTGGIGPVLKAAVQTRTTLPNVYFLVEFHFFAVYRLILNGFNYQNAITDLVIERVFSQLHRSEIFDVEFCQGHGVGCTFECTAIEVVSVSPFTPPSSYW
jgi:hypothetical protein